MGVDPFSSKSSVLRTPGQEPRTPARKHSFIGLGVALLVTALCSCKASVGGDAKAGNQGAEAQLDAFAGFDEQAVEDERGSVGEFAVTPEASGDDPALLGARHDLFVKGDAIENCTCLSVVAAAADDPRLAWEAKIPAINPATQMVVAFRMAGCSNAPEASRGAAYRGYRRSGDDVVVMVEEAHPGRPQVFGAIVPRPQPAGGLLLESVPATLPYAKPMSGPGSRCRVAL